MSKIQTRDWFSCAVCHILRSCLGHLIGWQASFVHCSKSMPIISSFETRIEFLNPKQKRFFFKSDEQSVIRHRQLVSALSAEYPVHWLRIGHFRETVCHTLKHSPVDNQAEFEDVEFTLHPNDLVVLLSDGVGETFNADRVILGRGAIVSVVENPSSAEAGVVSKETVNKAMDHRGDSPALDDMTVLALTVYPYDDANENMSSVKSTQQTQESL